MSSLGFFGTRRFEAVVFTTTTFYYKADAVIPQISYKRGPLLYPLTKRPKNQALAHRLPTELQHLDHTPTSEPKTSSTTARDS